MRQAQLTDSPCFLQEQPQSMSSSRLSHRLLQKPQGGLSVPPAQVDLGSSLAKLFWLGGPNTGSPPKWWAASVSFWLSLAEKIGVPKENAIFPAPLPCTPSCQSLYARRNFHKLPQVRQLASPETSLCNQTEYEGVSGRLILAGSLRSCFRYVLSYCGELPGANRRNTYCMCQHSNQKTGWSFQSLLISVATWPFQNRKRER